MKPIINSRVIALFVTITIFRLLIACSKTSDAASFAVPFEPGDQTGLAMPSNAALVSSPFTEITSKYSTTLPVGTSQIYQVSTTAWVAVQKTKAGEEFVLVNSGKIIKAESQSTTKLASGTEYVSYYNLDHCRLIIRRINGRIYVRLVCQSPR